MTSCKRSGSQLTAGCPDPADSAAAPAVPLQTFPEELQISTAAALALVTPTLIVAVMYHFVLCIVYVVATTYQTMSSLNRHV